MRIFLWALAGWLIFGLLGAAALLPSEAPASHFVAGFLMPGVFGLMIGGMIGFARRFKANQRELGRFLLTVIGGCVLFGTPFAQLTLSLDWPSWVAPVAATLGAFAGLAFSLRQFRQPISQAEGLLMLAATLILGYPTFGPLIVPILIVSALAIRHHMQKQPKC